MKLKEYIRIVRQWGWIVILLAVLTAGAAYGYSKLLMPEIYQSSVKVTVRPARADSELSSGINGLLRSLAGDITTHQFLSVIIDRGQFDTTTYDLLNGKILFVKDEASDFAITITARDPNPKVAADMVNLIAAYFKEQRDVWNNQQDKSDHIDVEIRDWARDASLYSPKPKINALAGGVVGGLIGVLIVLAMEWIQTSAIWSPEGIERLNIPALGAIPVRKSNVKR